jgi:hypothetical protein
MCIWLKFRITNLVVLPSYSLSFNFATRAVNTSHWFSTICETLLGVSNRFSIAKKEKKIKKNKKEIMLMFGVFWEQIMFEAFHVFPELIQANFAPCSCCSCQWDKTVSQICGHQQTCCLSTRLYMSVEPWWNDVGKENWRTQRKTCLCPSHIPHRLTQAQTWAFTVRGWWLTAWAMAPLLHT